MGLADQERMTGSTEIAAGVIASVGGFISGLGLAIAEVVKFSEARAYSAMLRLNLAPSLESYTVPGIAGSLGVVVVGGLLIYDGGTRLGHAELIEIANPDNTEA